MAFCLGGVRVGSSPGAEFLNVTYCEIMLKPAGNELTSFLLSAICVRNH